MGNYSLHFLSTPIYLLNTYSYSSVLAACILHVLIYVLPSFHAFIVYIIYIYIFFVLFLIFMQLICRVNWLYVSVTNTKAYPIYFRHSAFSFWLFTVMVPFNLVPRAHVPFGQHQDTELWNNQLARSQSPRVFFF